MEQRYNYEQVAAMLYVIIVWILLYASKFLLYIVSSYALTMHNIKMYSEFLSMEKTLNNTSVLLFLEISYVNNR